MDEHGGGAAEQHDDGVLVGRTYRDAPEIDGLVFVNGKADLGTIIPVEITLARASDERTRIV